MTVVTRSIFAIARCEMSTGKVIDVWSAPSGGFVDPEKQAVSTYGETEISEALRMASRLQSTEGNQSFLLQVVRGQETINYDLAQTKLENLPNKGRGETASPATLPEQPAIDVVAKPA